MEKLIIQKFGEHIGNEIIELNNKYHFNLHQNKMKSILKNLRFLQRDYIIYCQNKEVSLKYFRLINIRFFKLSESYMKDGYYNMYLQRLNISFDICKNPMEHYFNMVDIYIINGVTSLEDYKRYIENNPIFNFNRKILKYIYNKREEYLIERN